MAAPIPFFIVGPTMLISLIGAVRRLYKTEAPLAEDWRQAKVDVVVPAYNEEATIILCLDSLFRQNFAIRTVVVMDDGSRDRTRQFVEEYAAQFGRPIETMRSEKSIGKTPGVKRNARARDCDVLFVLDGDTILESPNYIEQTVQALYRGNNVASACGCVRPLRGETRHRLADTDSSKVFYGQHPNTNYFKQRGRYNWFLHGIVNIYRDFLYFYLQNFIYEGQMALFDSIINPVGCATAYRRELIRELFDYYEPTLGDNLTVSEDIFIGFALLARGYRNVQVNDVTTWSEEPVLQRLPRQVFLWSSSFVQSCYYFPSLLLSPFMVFKRLSARSRKEQRTRSQAGTDQGAQAGMDYTKRYGRPIGWPIFCGLLEKISFPLLVIVLLVLGAWEILGITLGVEMSILMLVTVVLAYRRRRPDYIWKAIVATPVRYFTMFCDLAVFVGFFKDVCVTGNFNWRK